MSDPINHPEHYTTGRIEPIEVIEDQGWLEGWALGNAISYIVRASHKGKQVEDLKKAIRCLEFFISHLETGNCKRSDLEARELDARACVGDEWSHMLPVSVRTHNCPDDGRYTFTGNAHDIDPGGGYER